MTRWITIGFAGLATLALSSACSGGGGTSTTAPVVASLGGAGTLAVFNQKVTFEINVPGTSANEAARLRRARVAATSTTPYVSPLTGSVLLSLAEVNGVSPQVAPPTIAAINVPATCAGSNAGCTIAVPNVPAAVGTDRYFVQTYTGANATGTLISSGFVDVTVTASGAQRASVGGTATLTIGGFVASIQLAPASVTFVQGTAASQNVVVQAYDAAGAAIIGANQYASPIVVSVGQEDTANFTIGGALSTTISGPPKTPLVLHYSGGFSASGGTLVVATSLNGSGAPVTSAPLTASVAPPGSVVTAPPSVAPGSTPKPGSTATPATATTSTPSTVLASPSPTAKPTPTVRPATPLSLYVADGQLDTISEYRIVTAISNGMVPSPTVTPSRVIGFDQANGAPTANIAGLSCGPVIDSPNNGNGTSGVAVDPSSGNIFLFPNCNDGQVGYVFGYPPDAVGTPAPKIADSSAVLFFGNPDGLAIANGKLFVGHNDSNSNNEEIVAFATTGSHGSTSASFGSTCYSEFGPIGSQNCFIAGYSGFGVDSSGYVYLPAEWGDDANSNPLVPNGDASSLIEPASMLALNSSGLTSATVAPQSAIAGLSSNVGGQGAPLAATVDGSILYVLVNPQILATQGSSGVEYYPGVSFCPPPSANAPINESFNPNLGILTPTDCADGAVHTYLAAYNVGAGSSLLNIANVGTDVDVTPDFLLGGDTQGLFGCTTPDGLGGQYIAASGGYVYIINQVPTCASGNNLAPEIDVYNTNGLTGPYTNQAPILRIPLTNAFPNAIAIGPSGSATGGQSLLRRAPTRPYHHALYAARWAAADAHRAAYLARRKAWLYRIRH